MGQFTRDIEPDGEIYNNQFVDSLIDAGFTATGARDVLHEAYTMGTSPEESKNFQRHFVDENGDVDVAKVSAMMHIQNTRMTADAYDPVLQERADNTDNSTEREALKEVVELMHASGYDAQEIAKTIERYIKISKAATPHPTEHLSPEGIDLARGLAGAAEVPHNERDHAIKSKLVEIAESDNFAPSKKADIVDEADNSNFVARIHNAGANEYDREIEQMIQEVTGERVDVNTNTGQKSWDFDADGKPNAEGFAMMMKITTTTRGALEDVSKNLELTLQRDLDGKTRQDLSDLKDDVDKVMSNMEHVYERSRAITRELAAEGDADKREALYRGYHDKEFEGLFGQLASIYDDVDPKTRGLDFYQDTLETLDQTRKQLEESNPQAAASLDDSYRSLTRNGFALEKGQTRHNDLVYKEMLDRMFAIDESGNLSQELEDLGILNQEDKALIAQSGKFSAMPHEDEYEIMQKVLKYAKDNGNREIITGILEDVNPLEFGKNGYPAQTASYTDRMRLRAVFPYKFDEGVISDAGAYGSPRQKFIADLYGIENMKHMSLNEDKMNLARQGSLPRMFNQFGGADNLESRTKKRRDIEKRMTKALHIMRPASDAERAGGSFTRLQAIDQYRKIVHEAYDMKVPIEVMIGGGQSLNRFGGDVDMVRRLLAQELKDILVDKKQNGGQIDDYDRDMMMMATSVLYTEQGRTKRMMSATPGQVCDGLMKKTTNILKDYLDLNGDVEDFTFIDRRKHFSEEMQHVQKGIWEKGIEDYSSFNMAFGTDENGNVTDDLLLDKYAAIAAPMETVGYQNNGSRPAAGKASSDKQAQVSGFRAIGKDQTLYSMQSFHAGFYGSGNAMARFRNALIDGKIKQSDVNDMMEDPDWDEAIFSRNLIDASRFNATHLAEQVFGESEAKNWDYDRLMELGRQVNTINAGKDADGNEKYKLAYKAAEGKPQENVSEEQMYFAKIYYDRARFLAMTEAALSPKHDINLASDENEILNAFRPETGLEITLGERTQERWPTVMDEVLQDHLKNAPAYALNNLVDNDIRTRKADNQSKEDIDAHYGQGNPSMAEKFFRGISSALRSGTLAHKGKWTGNDSIGLSQRQNINMRTIIDYTKMMFGRGGQEATPV